MGFGVWGLKFGGWDEGAVGGAPDEGELVALGEHVAVQSFVPHYSTLTSGLRAHAQTLSEQTPFQLMFRGAPQYTYSDGEYRCILE